MLLFYIIVYIWPSELPSVVPVCVHHLSVIFHIHSQYLSFRLNRRYCYCTFDCLHIAKVFHKSGCQVENMPPALSRRLSYIGYYSRLWNKQWLNIANVSINCVAGLHLKLSRPLNPKCLLISIAPTVFICVLTLVCQIQFWRQTVCVCLGKVKLNWVWMFVKKGDGNCWGEAFSGLLNIHWNAFRRAQQIERWINGLEVDPCDGSRGPLRRLWRNLNGHSANIHQWMHLH